MISDDELGFYYEQVETLWLGGVSPTLEHLRERIGPGEADARQFAEGLATLVERGWVRVQEISVGAWSAEVASEVRYETWYIPVRDRPFAGDEVT
jgi:hypothetical protein